MLIAGVSTTQVAQTSGNTDPAPTSNAAAVQPESLEQQEQIGQQLIKSVPEAQEDRQVDQRVGGKIDVYA